MKRTCLCGFLTLFIIAAVHSPAFPTTWYLTPSGPMTIQDAVTAAVFGGRVTIENNFFLSDGSDFYGGGNALYLSRGNHVVRNCTLAKNGWYYDAVEVNGGAAVLIENCLFAYTNGDAITCGDGGTAGVYCNNFSGQYDICATDSSGNAFLDPCSLIRITATTVCTRTLLVGPETMSAACTWAPVRLK